MAAQERQMPWTLSRIEITVLLDGFFRRHVKHPARSGQFPAGGPPRSP